MGILHHCAKSLAGGHRRPCENAHRTTGVAELPTPRRFAMPWSLRPAVMTSPSFAAHVRAPRAVRGGPPRRLPRLDGGKALPDPHSAKSYPPSAKTTGVPARRWPSLWHWWTLAPGRPLQAAGIEALPLNTTFEGVSIPTSGNVSARGAPPLECRLLPSGSKHLRCLSTRHRRILGPDDAGNRRIAV